MPPLNAQNDEECDTLAVAERTQTDHKASLQCDYASYLAFESGGFGCFSYNSLQNAH
jgi:hypothetical protein